MKSDIIVSICCITYNHEKYIGNCLEGFVIQKINFPIEILIHDDASTDGTAGIIKEYQIKYPNLVKPIFQKVNKYSVEGGGMNIRYNFPRAQGKYIAMCEGDDYWTDSLKLQKQVDFLENNVEYGICFHDVLVYVQKTGNLLKDYLREVPETTTIKDLAYGNYIHTPSVVFRNNFIFPEWISKAYIGDWCLYMCHIKSKKIKKINETMAVYRIHHDGIFSGKDGNFIRQRSRETTRLLIERADLPINVKKILFKRLNRKKMSSLWLELNWRFKRLMGKL